MNLSILAAKRLFTKNGEDILDLTDPVIGPAQNGIRILDRFYVSDMEMRPDLISHVAYRDPRHYDKILKFNGISNPYSIDSYQMLYIPQLADFESKFDTVKKPKATASEDNSIRSQYIEKETEIDDKRNSYHSLIKSLKQLNGVKQTPMLPPNIQDEGKGEGRYEVVDGQNKIIL